jgi:hypothetical protein
MQTTGRVQARECHARVLVPRQDVTGADRQWADQYEPGNVVRYARGSQVLGIAAGEYARVVQVHAHDNRVTVARAMAWNTQTSAARTSPTATLNRPNNGAFVGSVTSASRSK